MIENAGQADDSFESSCPLSSRVLVTCSLAHLPLQRSSNLRHPTEYLLSLRFTFRNDELAMMVDVVTAPITRSLFYSLHVFLLNFVTIGRSRSCAPFIQWTLSRSGSNICALDKMRPSSLKLRVVHASSLASLWLTHPIIQSLDRAV